MTPQQQIECTQAVADETSDSERLTWSGIPRQGLFLRRSDFLLIPFSLIWVWFVALFERLALKADNLLMLLWSIPFVVAGIYLLAGRFFWDSWRRRTTYYGLTDDRAIIVQKGWPASSRSVDLAGVPELNLTESSNGRGTITFGPTPSVALIAHPTYANASPSFDEIEDVRSVYEEILRARSEARS